MSTLLPILDAALASAAQRSGAHLVCRPGCTQCCHGVFAISQQDAARLRDGLASLGQADPARAARILTRVAASIARLTPHFPGDSITGILAGDYEDWPLFADPAEFPAPGCPAPAEALTSSDLAIAHLGDSEPCPVLDPATGTCDLYAHRPTLCRTFGPPLRDADGNLTHCELCYTTAAPEEIAACQLDPTLPNLIAASDDAFDAAHHLAGETLVAFALRPE